ncbi:MAG: ABC transporter substrate-binding protein [Desulfobacteraceae bacterium]
MKSCATASPLILSVSTVIVIITIVIISRIEAEPNEKRENKKGGELAVAMDDCIRHLNPAVQSGTATGIPGSQLFASLLRIDRQGNYHPYLAKSWQMAENGLSCTFRLRKGAVFHDGRPITSQDVAFSIASVRQHHPFKSMLAAVEAVETPTPLTAVVRLNQPHPALLQVAASPMLPIIPKHIYGDGRNLKTHPANWKVVGSGPFKLNEVKENNIIMDRFADFFIPGKPYLDRIEFVSVNTRSVPAMFESGVIHLWGFSASGSVNGQLEKFDHLKVDYDIHVGTGPQMWLAFNLRTPPFEDLRVRQAIAYAIDREFLVSKLFNGRACTATGPISPGSFFYTDDVEQYNLDVEKANRLLDEAGYPRDPRGMRFNAKIDVLPPQLEFLEAAEYLRNDLLRKTGVNLEIIRHKSFPQWAERVSNWNFDLVIDDVYNWGDPVIGVHRTYDSTNIRKGVIWTNTQGYRNDAVDTLMELAGRETDLKKRKSLYVEFQRLVARELPVYWLAEVPFATIHHRDLAGFDNSIWGPMFPYDEVYWKR